MSGNCQDSGRDPKTNPLPGDVLCKGKLRRTVTRVLSGSVYYQNAHGRESNCWITTWIQWCRKAEVSG